MCVLLRNVEINIEKRRTWRACTLQVTVSLGRISLINEFTSFDQRYYYLKTPLTNLEINQPARAPKLHQLGKNNAQTKERSYWAHLSVTALRHRALVGP